MNKLNIDPTTAETSLIYFTISGEWVVKIQNSKVKTIHLEQNDVTYIENILITLIRRLDNLREDKKQ